MKRVGIITSGGDCGGLNGVIKGAAYMAINHGATCFIIPSGYAGLYNLVDFNKLTELTEERLDKINANMAKTSKINLAPEIFPPGYKGPGSTNGGNGWMGP